MSDRRLALVVAVDSYDHPALHRLAAPAADAAALADVLGDPDLGAFEVDILHNPTSWAASERVEGVLADRHSTDLVLLHFSCHGLKDDSGELYLAATNTRPDLLGSTAIDAAWVNRVMQRSRAQRVVLLLDCCYGGAFERGVVSRAGGAVDVGDQFRQRQLGEGRGRVVITASTAMEYAFEGTHLADGSGATPSIFTGALVEGIRTGDADRDQDGHVALSELYDYVYDRVREQTPNQSPSKWEFGLRGDLYVARNPHRRPPSRLAPELADLVRHPVAAARLAAVHELAALLTDHDETRAAEAREALQRLSDDDSRQVSAAAAEALAPPKVSPPAATEALASPPSPPEAAASPPTLAASEAAASLPPPAASEAAASPLSPSGAEAAASPPPPAGAEAAALPPAPAEAAASPSPLAATGAAASPPPPAATGAAASPPPPAGAEAAASPPSTPAARTFASPLSPSGTEAFASPPQPAGAEALASRGTSPSPAQASTTSGAAPAAAAPQPSTTTSSEDFSSLPDKSGIDEGASVRSASVDERAKPQSGDLPAKPQADEGAKPQSDDLSAELQPDDLPAVPQPDDQSAEPQPDDQSAVPQPVGRSAEPQPVDRSAAAEAAAPRDSRLRDVVRVVAIMAIIAAVGIGLIWASDRWGHADDSGNASATGRDYEGLRAKLPASLRDTCHSEAPGSSNSTARAQCATGEFALWRSKAAMHEELGVYGTTAGDCTSAPPAGERRSAGLPAGRTGSVVCELLNSDQPAANQRYCVEWGVDDLLLTGSFYSTEGGGQASYRDTYDEAMATLGQLPT